MKMLEVVANLLDLLLKKEGFMKEFWRSLVNRDSFEFIDLALDFMYDLSIIVYLQLKQRIKDFNNKISFI
jgi:hypothetical protein